MTELRTESLQLDPQEPDPAAIRRIAAVIEGGGLVVLPTDTVYGLVCDPRQAAAVERVYRVKQRRRDLPLALLLRDMAQAVTYAEELPAIAARAMQEFWPGALTVVLRDRGEATAAVRARKDTIGLRLPAHVIPRLVAAELGAALASTSANRSGQPASTSAQQAREYVEGLVELVADGGPTPGGQESTVVDFSVSPPRILRAGALGSARLREVLGEVRLK